MSETAYLTDNSGNILATLDVEIFRRTDIDLDKARISDRLKQLIRDHDYVDGVITEENFPDHAIALFEEFEDLVNSHIYSLLDECIEKIESLDYKVQVPPDETLYSITELQIFDGATIAFFVLGPV